MKRNILRLCLGLFVCFLGCVSAWGQSVSTAQINGSVHDASGLAVPGAEIRVTQTETGAVRTVTSGADGGYVLTNLPIGPYQLEVSKEGFSKYVQSGIVLQVAGNPEIEVSLKVGNVSEILQVEANAAMVETQNSGIGQVVENQRILELPLNGRNVTDLITLQGAAVQTGTTSNRSFAGSPIISVGGGLELGTAYYLDGAQHNDPYNNQAHPFPFPDALQEFKVETSGLSAQHSQGTSVNSVTKSGTNNFHGDAFEFLRNDLFNARNYFATTNSTLKRHQFGGTAGGPILKNKLFAFGGYQRTTIRQDPANLQAFVPTAAMLAGDFRTVASATCQAGGAISLKAPFANNQISPALFDKAAQNIAAKLPKSTDPCGLITFGAPSPENDGQLIGRLDYQMSEKHSLFGRYMFTNSKIAHPFSFTPDNILNTNARSFDNLAQAGTFGDTYLITPNTVNSFRAAVLRVAVTRIGAKFFSAPDVGINIYSYLPQFMVLSVNAGFNVGSGTGNDSSYITTTYQLSDDVTHIRGAHQYAMGWSISQGRNYTLSNQMSPGNFTFNGQALGLGSADFFLGRVSNFSQSGPVILSVKEIYTGLYAQDSWKVSPRLTLNYGLRWEPYIPQVFTNGAVYNFDANRFLAGTKSTTFPTAPAGLYFPGDPGFPSGLSGVHKQWAHFNPRVGLAWDPQGNGRMSVRASFGLSYAYVPLQMRIDSVNASPWSSSTTLLSPAGGLSDPWQGIVGGNPFPLDPTQKARFVPNGSYISVPYDIKPTTVQSWNLAVQRQIGSDWLASGTYIGSHQVHVWVNAPLNTAIYFPGGPCTLNGTTYTTCSTTANINQRRPFSLLRPADGQLLGFVTSFEAGGTQDYHGMLLSVWRRATRGVTLNANYTWSHCIGDSADTRGMGPGQGTSYQDPNNRKADRGNCSGDRRHVFNLTAVAETPRFSNRIVRATASGWRLSTIYRYSTGAYLTVTSGTDRALNGVAGQRPNQVLPNVYGDGSVNNWLNPAAFQPAATGSLGTLGAMNILGPAYFGLDMGLSRSFQIFEGQRLEIRAEAYNVTNSLRKGNPNVALNLNNFGRINTAGDPRIMQFAIKYVF